MRSFSFKKIQLEAVKSFTQRLNISYSKNNVTIAYPTIYNFSSLLNILLSYTISYIFSLLFKFLFDFKLD